MKEEKITHISAKLSLEFDKDLLDDINTIPKRERSHIYREALRKYFKEKKEGDKK